MKLPVFVYNYRAKQYELFPYHLLTTLSNGKLGIRVNNRDRNCNEKWNAISRYRYLFLNNVQMDVYADIREYTLKEQR